MRLRTLLLALLAVVLPLAAHALELVAPAHGVTLRGGTIAAVEWKAGTLPRDSEEWEAFLSVDGGHYYGYRITPHLDIGIRRFSFTVPNVDTDDARIMIRTGDEERETRFEMPVAFSIARDPRAVSSGLSMEPGHGESAREGDPAVLEWAEGSRDGSGVRQRCGNAAPGRALVHVSDDAGENETTLAPDQLPISLRLLTTRERAVAKSVSLAAATPLRAIAVLLVCRRLNI